MRLSSGFQAVVAAGLAAFALSACGGSNDKEVSFKSGGMTHTFSAGQATNTQDFPLPIYPNAEKTGEVQASGDEDDSKFLMLSSNDSVDKVGEFYKTKLTADGWSVTDRFRQGDKLVNLNATKDKQEASVMISAGGEGNSATTITISVGKQSNDGAVQTGQNFTPDKLNPPTD